MGLLSDLSKGEGGVGGVIVFYTLVFITAVVGINFAWYFLGAMLKLFGVNIGAAPIGVMFVILFWALIGYAAFAGITTLYKATTAGDRVIVLVSVIVIIAGLYALSLKAPGAFPADFQAALIQMQSIISRP